MNTLAINNPLASEIKCTEDELIVSLKDGRVLHLPLSWFPKLLHATPSQRVVVAAGILYIKTKKLLFADAKHLCDVWD